MNVQKADVQRHCQSPTGVILDLKRRSTPPHSPSPLGVRHFSLALGEEDKIISKQLGPDAVPEPALSRFGFVIYFSEFLSKTKFRLSKRRGKKGKLVWTRCGDDPDNLAGAQATPTSGWCILTMTGDFFERYGGTISS